MRRDIKSIVLAYRTFFSIDKAKEQRQRMESDDESIQIKKINRRVFIKFVLSKEKNLKKYFFHKNSNSSSMK